MSGGYGRGGSKKIRRLAFAEDAVRVVIYLLIALSGAAVLHHPPRTYDLTAQVLTYAWGGLQLAALLGVIAIVTGRPLLEWWIVTPVALGILLYAVLSYQAVGRDGLGHLPRASDVNALALYPVARFFAIWIQVEQAKRIAASASRVRGGRNA